MTKQRIRLKSSTREILETSETVLLDSEICLIAPEKGKDYDSLVIGNGINQAKDLPTIPLNIMNGSIFLGLADKNLDPPTPTESVFYIAKESGVYSGFGLSAEEGELAFFIWKKGKWTKSTILLIDNELSETSGNPISNRAVTKDLKTLTRDIYINDKKADKDSNRDVHITVDSDLSPASENPVMNKTVTGEINKLNDWYEE